MTESIVCLFECRFVHFGLSTMIDNRSVLLVGANSFAMRSNITQPSHRG